MESPKRQSPPYQAAAPPSPRLTSSIPTSTPLSCKKPSISPSPFHLSNYVSASIPLQDLLSASLKRRLKPSCNLIHEDSYSHALVMNLTSRKKRRGQAAVFMVAAASGFPGGYVASPRVSRRARRRLDKEVVVLRDEREEELGNEEEEGGVTGRRKWQCKAKKMAQVVEPREDPSLISFAPPIKNTYNGEL